MLITDTTVPEMYVASVVDVHTYRRYIDGRFGKLGGPVVGDPIIQRPYLVSLIFANSPLSIVNLPSDT